MKRQKEISASIPQLAIGGVIFFAVAMAASEPCCAFSGDAFQPGDHKVQRQPAQEIRAAFRTYLDALITGDPDNVRVIYDESTEAGKAVASFYSKYAKAMAVMLKIEKTAKDRLGENGLKAVHSQFKWDAKKTTDETKKALQAMEVYVGEQGKTAVVYLPGYGVEYFRLRKVNDKWFYEVDKSLLGKARAYSGFLDNYLRRLNDVDTILKNSKNIEELRESLGHLEKLDLPKVP